MADNIKEKIENAGEAVKDTAKKAGEKAADVAKSAGQAAKDRISTHPMTDVNREFHSTVETGA